MINMNQIIITNNLLILIQIILFHHKGLKNNFLALLMIKMKMKINNLQIIKNKANN